MIVFVESLQDANTEIHRNFIMAVKDTPSAIISTNYDILIDNRLAEVNCINYGAKLRYPLVWGYMMKGGMARARLSGDEHLNFGNVSLLKIHGSLNWLYCRKCDEVDITIGTKAVDNSRHVLYCADAGCTNTYEHLLITPTMFKNYENRFIRQVWERAEQALIEANKLVFIGYALKEEDYQIRCLLMKALLNKSATYGDVMVVEKRPETKADEATIAEIRNKYTQLYGDVQVKAMGFKEYVNSMKG